MCKVGLCLALEVSYAYLNFRGQMKENLQTHNCILHFINILNKHSICLLNSESFYSIGNFFGSFSLEEEIFQDFQTKIR